MLDDINKILPLLGVLVGGVGAYYGALNAMKERLTRVETRFDAHIEAHKEEISHLRDRVEDAHSRINRMIEGSHK